jgi:hypothetical protein
MKSRMAIATLVGAVLLSGTGLANAQWGSRYYRDQAPQSYRYQRGYYDYDYWASRHASSPADRAGAGNFKNLTPPPGGAGRVNSHTQN